MKMNLKKGDIMTNAMEEFWGRRENVPQESIKVIGMNEDMITPESASEQLESEGMSIREKVESGVDETTDLAPNPNAAARYSDAPQRTQSRGNMFDLGGLDEMNQRQLMKERGGGLGLGFGGTGEKLNARQKIERELANRELRNLKAIDMYTAAERKLELQRQRTKLQAGMQQSRTMNESQLIMNKSFKDEINKGRYAAGLPVYESPWDIIAGGKRAEMIKNEKGIWVPSGKIERFGGLFGAGRDIYQGYKDVMPHIKNTAQKATTKVDEFAVDAKGVFKTAKTNAGKVGRTIDIKVGSFLDESGISKKMDNIIESKPGNRFIDDFLNVESDLEYRKKHPLPQETPEQRHQNNIWSIDIAKQPGAHAVHPKVSKNPNLSGVIDYPGRKLNPESITSMPFDFSNRTQIPNIEPARVIEKPAEKYNENMINSVMGQMNNDKKSWTSSEKEVKDLRDIK